MNPELQLKRINMTTTIILVAFIFLSILIATATGWVARKTGRSFGLWFFLSILMPMIALCALICLPEKKFSLYSRKKEKYIVNKPLFDQLLQDEDVIMN
jgi:hypothetical protein